MESKKREDNVTDGRLDWVSFMLRKNWDAEWEITSKKTQEELSYENSK